MRANLSPGARCYINKGVYLRSFASARNHGFLLGRTRGGRGEKVSAGLGDANESTTLS
jgi:hypothetical protein